MRLHWFLPSVRPAEEGPLRRTVRKIAPTWLYSPLRRLIQTGSLAAFLLLLFLPFRPGGRGVPVQWFLMLDPLVAISTALAAKMWVWPLAWAGAIVAASLILPRLFCGYFCPLGTVIDLFDWAVSRRVRRLRIRRRGWRANLKYFILIAAILSAVVGVPLAGLVAPIPMLTRGMLFALARPQGDWVEGWQGLAPVGAGYFIALGSLAAALGLGLLGARFWCCYVCPSGAIFSAVSRFRLTERKVSSRCTFCNKCLEVCPFDAARRRPAEPATECAFCQTCAGACPAGAIHFVGRWQSVAGGAAPPAGRPTDLSRRGLLVGALASAAAGAALAFGIRKVSAGNFAGGSTGPAVRPPGSVPEEQFLQLCVRCGECLKVCPTGVLEPVGLQHGLADLWTPQVRSDRAGCRPDCNRCGQVCPSGAIRALPLGEKRAARMGRAVVNRQTCLPHSGRQECMQCAAECSAAGYDAIEASRVHVELEADGKPVEDSGFLAPVVLDEKCVGCGLCQARCNRLNVRQRGLLDEPAIVVSAGADKEDRVLAGSYRELARRRQQAPQTTSQPAGDSYLPDSLR